jgi:ElaA protein
MQISIAIILMGWQDDFLLAYSRLVPPGLSYKEASIGRVVTSPAGRGSGMGKALIEKSIEEVFNLYGNGPIKIGAQFYLKNLYTAFGFEQIGDIYDEDGIDHIKMIRK